MTALKSVRSLLIVGGLAVLATGCTNMEEMPGPGGDQQKACTREYMPVCGGKGHKRKTFPNACEANNAGYSVVKEGKCVG